MQGRLRAMKSALDARVGVDVRDTSNILPWMVKYASVLINRYLVEKDGRTAYERLRGKKSKMLGFEFGESVRFRKAGSESSTTYGRRDSPWDTGRRVASTWCPTAREVTKTRTMKRIPETERWDKSEIEGMTWTPWKFKARGGAGSPGEAGLRRT